MPADDLDGFSVDTVDKKDIAGPHHIHPQDAVLDFAKGRG